ncbi:Uncharacterized protein FWK35_00000904 [Aphis craccivora]|uniref:Uncharacterized protein n=1 Tax=Aphis craccivora TaxID=307492 RepID=A0A6G0ZNS1_APHCR|nr:Uncharacterized protein FWK35_00000904 [Aphis craccivora]
MRPVSDRKVNLVGTLGVKSKKFPIVFKSVRKKPKKVTEKRKFLRKTIFDKIDFFIWLVDKKILDDQNILKI